MALQRQKIEFSLAGGIATKPDEKIVGPNFVAEAKNVVFSTSGTARKRSGGRELLKRFNLFGFEGPIQDIGKLASCGDEIVALGLVGDENITTPSTVTFGGMCMTYGLNAGSWLESGILDPVTIASKRVSTVLQLMTQYQDVAISDKYIVYFCALNDSGAANGHVVVEDRSTGSMVLIGRNLVTSVTQDTSVRCVYFGNTFATIYDTGGSVRARYADESDIHSWTGPTIIVATLHADAIWDATSIPGKKFVIAFKNSSATLTVATIDETLTEIDSVTISVTPTECVSVASVADRDGSTEVCVAWKDNSSNDINFQTLETDMTGGTTRTLFSSITDTVVNITMIESPETTRRIGLDPNNKIKFLVETVGSASYEQAILFGDRLFEDITSVPTPFTYYHFGLKSKAFVNKKRVHVWVGHESALQSSYFLLSFSNDPFSSNADDLPATSAKALYGRGPRLSAVPGLSHVHELSDGVFITAQERQDRNQSDGEVARSMVALIADLGNKNIPDLCVGKNLYFASGHLAVFDGLIQENGYHLFPENLAVSAQTSGGSMADGTYSYRVVFEYTDRSGEIHFSAPSPAISATVSGGGGSGSVDLTVQTLTATTGYKEDRIIAHIYRTEDAGTRYYKTGNSVASDKTALTVAVTDTTSDANLINNELIYTDGGVLDNISPPAVYDLTVSGGRMFVIQADDRSRILYSKKKISGVAFEFSDLLVLENPGVGDLTAITAIDGRLVAFTNDQVFYFSGDGPNSTGSGGAINGPFKVTSPVGVTDRASVVEYPDGVIFKSRKGFYLLNRSLETSYIGSLVDAFNKFSVIDSTHMRDQNEIRFILRDGPTLVFDYFENKWSTHTSENVTASTIWGKDGSYVWSTKDGSVFTADGSYFQDGNVPFSMSITTSWIKMSGTQGYQRIWWAYFLGEFKSGHKINVDVSYDYNDAVVQTVTFDTSTMLNAKDRLYQLRLKPARQKCQAIKFRIYDSEQVDSKESYSISFVGLEYGVKDTMNRRMPPRKSA